MSLVTNMDHSKKPEANVPQLEFSLPIDEIKESVEVGAVGEVVIPCEVTMVKDGIVSFRKKGKSRSEGAFVQATVAQLRDMLPKADEDEEDEEDTEDKFEE
jgi:hypothetical protein